MISCELKRAGLRLKMSSISALPADKTRFLSVLWANTTHFWGTLSSDQGDAGWRKCFIQSDLKRNCASEQAGPLPQSPSAQTRARTGNHQSDLLRLIWLIWLASDNDFDFNFNCEQTGPPPPPTVSQFCRFSGTFSLLITQSALAQQTKTAQKQTRQEVHKRFDTSEEAWH